MHRSISAIFAASLLGLLAQAQSVSLTWDPNTEADLAGYNIYRSLASGTGYVKINPETIAPNLHPPESYEDKSIAVGLRYYYVATALNTADLESGFSNEVSYALCLGDANLDGARNVLDSLQILNHAVGNLTLSGNAYIAADANLDGVVNVLDALAIQNDIVGNVTLPECP